MKVFGTEAPASFKPLTAGELRKYLNELHERDPESDGYWVHFLNMEEPAKEAESTVGQYATEVEADVFDSDTGDEDATKGYPCVSLKHWPSREEFFARHGAKPEEPKP